MIGEFVMEQKMKNYIIKAIDGNDKAFQKIYERYYKQSYYFALKITGNPADAADSVQDAFVQIKNSLKDLRNPEYFNAWLNKIVFTKCTKLFAKNKYAAMDPELMRQLPNQQEERIEFDPKRYSRYQSDKEVLMAMIDELHPQHKEAVLLYYFEDLPVKEIADILEIPEGTVKSRIKIARDTLKKKLELYHKLEGEKITFNEAAFHALIISALQADFLIAAKGFMVPVISSFLIPKHGFSQLSNMLNAAAVTVTAGTVIAGGIMAYNTLSNDKPIEQPIIERPLVHEAIRLEKKAFPSTSYENETDGRKIDSALEAYFICRGWAYDGSEMKDKTIEEINQIKPVYESIKQFQGTYYEMLKHDDWISSYEQLLGK